MIASQPLQLVNDWTSTNLWSCSVFSPHPQCFYSAGDTPRSDVNTSHLPSRVGSVPPLTALRTFPRHSAATCVGPELQNSSGLGPRPTARRLGLLVKFLCVNLVPRGRFRRPFISARWIYREKRLSLSSIHRSTIWLRRWRVRAAQSPSEPDHHGDQPRQRAAKARVDDVRQTELIWTSI